MIERVRIVEREKLDVGVNVLNVRIVSVMELSVGIMLLENGSIISNCCEKTFTVHSMLTNK